MAEVIGVRPCPICSTEVSVKLNKNKKPGFYCPGCKVNVQSSGGKSLEFIHDRIKSRPAESGEAVKKEEVKNDEHLGTVGKTSGESGEQKRRGFFERVFGSDED